MSLKKENINKIRQLFVNATNEDIECGIELIQSFQMGEDAFRLVLGYPQLCESFADLYRAIDRTIYSPHICKKTYTQRPTRQTSVCSRLSLRVFIELTRNNIPWACNIRSLDLHGYYLFELPESIGKLTALTQLNVRWNKLTGTFREPSPPHRNHD